MEFEIGDEPNHPAGGGIVADDPTLRKRPFVLEDHLDRQDRALHIPEEED